MNRVLQVTNWLLPKKLIALGKARAGVERRRRGGGKRLLKNCQDGRGDF